MTTEKLRLYYLVSKEHSSDELIIKTAAHLTGKSPNEFKIFRQRGKKPYFENSDLKFSVSHSGDVWICVYAPGEIGCDIQQRRAGIRFRELSERWFTQNEADRIRTEQDFYDIWSEKEAYTKMLGTGIDEKFRKIDTTSLSDAVLKDIMISDIGDGYSCAVAYSSEFELELYNISEI